VPEIACVNGEFMPLEQATVSVEDRGYQFADAVYEVIRTYRGRPFAVEEHLARLFRSLDAIHLKHSYQAEWLKSLIAEAIQRAGFAETLVYLQISRGVAPRHRRIPDHYTPTLVMTAREMHDTTDFCQRGVSVITVPDNRWGRCDIKTVALLPNVLAYRTAREAGAHDAIFVGENSAIYEATAANVFIVRKGELHTPPEGPKILSGITRGKILRAARAVNIHATERPIPRSELLAADEAFLCSTTAEVVPIVAVDGQTIGRGPLAERIYQKFLDMFTT